MTNLNAQPFVSRIEYLCDFIDTIKVPALSRVPTSMPRNLGSLGFDEPLWVGLGVVGLWGTLDAFADRAGFSKEVKCPICDGRSCVAHRFDSKVMEPADRKGLKEMEDIRHLYAHHYPGTAENEFYFGSRGQRKRHVFKQSVPHTLSCGAQFNGSDLSLRLRDLRFYCDLTRHVLVAAR